MLLGITVHHLVSSCAVCFADHALFLYCVVSPEEKTEHNVIERVTIEIRVDCASSYKNKRVNFDLSGQEVHCNVLLRYYGDA